MAALVVQSRFAGLKIEDDDYPPSNESKSKKTKANTAKKPDPAKKSKNNNATKPQQQSAPKKKKNKQPAVSSEQWEQWKQKDEELVDGNYETELEQAILLSKLDYEEKKDVYKQIKKDMEMEKKLSDQAAKNTKNKKKKNVMSLDQFNDMMNTGDEVKSHHEEAILPAEARSPDKDTEFFDRVQVEAKSELLKDKIIDRVRNRKNVPQEVLSRSQFLDALERKEREVEALKAEVTALKEELLAVKSRNKKLCRILGQGEMKDKAEILVEVDRLRNVQNELTAEIESLHSELERERSKNQDHRAKDKEIGVLEAEPSPGSERTLSPDPLFISIPEIKTENGSSSNRERTLSPEPPVYSMSAMKKLRKAEPSSTRERILSSEPSIYSMSAFKKTEEVGSPISSNSATKEPNEPLSTTKRMRSTEPPVYSMSAVNKSNVAGSLSSREQTLSPEPPNYSVSAIKKSKKANPSSTKEWTLSPEPQIDSMSAIKKSNVAESSSSKERRLSPELLIYSKSAIKKPKDLSLSSRRKRTRTPEPLIYSMSSIKKSKEAEPSSLCLESNLSMIPMEKPKKRRPMTSKDKLKALDIYEHLFNTSETYPFKTEIVKQVAKIMGTSRITISKVLTEKKKSGKLSSPKRTKERKGKLSQFDDSVLTEIRKKVNQFYLNNEPPTLKKVLAAINEDKDLPSLSKSSLHTLLRRDGFLEGRKWIFQAKMTELLDDSHG